VSRVPRTIIDRRAFLASGLAAAGGLALAGGCNIVAPVAAVLAGPPKRDAQFKLPKRKTVVFVDDRQGVIPLRSRQMRREIGRTVTDVLNTKDNLLPGLMIDAGDAIAFADSRDRGDGLLPLGVIGQEVGAEVLIAVRVDIFSLQPAGTPQPTAQASVWILDITNRTRLFPPPESNQPATVVTASLLIGDGMSQASESQRVQIFFELASQLGREVAKLFYRHEIKPLGERLEPR
jgi:hypothetical protein